MVFNATFNNISVISWWSVLLVQETGVPGEFCVGTIENTEMRFIKMYEILICKFPMLLSI
jgi:hypothetical protein